MFTNLGAPTVEQLSGHWYLVAGSPGFLERFPRIETLQGYSVPRDENSFTFNCLATSPGRSHTFSKVIVNESRRGPFRRARFTGPSVLLRSWHMGISADGLIHSGYHPGSMLIPGGLLLYVRAEMAEAEARKAVRSHASEIGLTERDLETLVWRARPADIVIGEVPSFVSSRPSGWIDMMCAVVGTRTDAV